MASLIRPISDDVQLPEELYDLILRHSSRDTLRISRFVCRRFNEFSKRHLFRTVYLKVHIDSFLNLDTISKDPQLRFMVREIVYDPTLLPWDLNNFDLYCYQGAGRGLCLEPEDYNASWSPAELRDQFIRNLPPLQLAYHYQQYCRYLAGQKYLHGDSNESDQLTEIFGRLPRLQRIELLRWWAPEGERPTIRYSDWKYATVLPKSAGAVVQQTLIQPRGNQFRLNRVLAMMRASHATNQYFSSLKTGPINVTELDKRVQATDSDYIETCVAKLERLQLEFTTDVSIQNTVGYLETFLSFARKLEVLDLTGEVRLKYPEMGSFPGELKDIVWPALKSLRLTFVTVDQGEFLHLLNNHTSRLKSLGLNNIHVRGSFVGILIFLAEEMQLESLDLEGSIGNSDECWQIASGRDTRFTLAEKLSFRQRVINYVLSPDPFPFNKPSIQLDDEEGLGKTAGWIAEDDNSFRKAVQNVSHNINGQHTSDM